MGLIKAILAPFICRVLGHDWVYSWQEARRQRRCRRCRTRQRMVPPTTTVELILNDRVVGQTTIGRD